MESSSLSRPRPILSGVYGLLLGLFLLLSGCSESLPAGTCVTDGDCPAAGTRCDVNAGQCICTADEACEPGSFCNRSGVCQIQAGCVNNQDCREAGTFCDLSTGTCLAGPPLMTQAACGVASHCPFGTICTNATCVEGCHSDGDCNLGDVCLSGQCQTGDGLCSTKDFCEYGELCEDNLCKKDFQPYCRRCTQRTIQNPEPCDEPRNFCLINNRELGGFTQFCGTDCSSGQPCAAGYGCNNVVILTEATCFNTAQCQCDGPTRFATKTCTVSSPCVPDGNGTNCTVPGQLDCNGGVAGDATCVLQRGATSGNCTCATDDDCEGDSVCTSGLCCGATVRPERECRGGEGTTSGFCSCAIDDDCPNNSCDGSRSACSITGTFCEPGNGDCEPIPCVNGGCLIGQNCAPEQGLSCSDLLP